MTFERRQALRRRRVGSHVVEPFGEAGPGRLVQRLGPGLEVLADHGDEAFAGVVGPRRREDTEAVRQETIGVEEVERGQQHAPGQIARTAEQHHCVSLRRHRFSRIAVQGSRHHGRTAKQRQAPRTFVRNKPPVSEGS
jgi:hypothetical protein